MKIEGYEKARAILLDIEGTTTPVDFVHETMFNFARARLRPFLSKSRNDGQVRECLDDLFEAKRSDLESGAYTEKAEPTTDFGWDALIRYIEWLIDGDSKLPSLKHLEGFIWREGFESGNLEGQVYGDVPPTLKRWYEQGKVTCIYSSGSVLSQRLLFTYSSEGDLTPFIMEYFDNSIGLKKESESYRMIATSRSMIPDDFVFFSDSIPELEAARTAGMKVCLVSRSEERVANVTFSPVIRSFNEIDG